jgi:hypothetical protein
MCGTNPNPGRVPQASLKSRQTDTAFDYSKWDNLSQSTRFD